MPGVQELYGIGSINKEAIFIDVIVQACGSRESSLLRYCGGCRWFVVVVEVVVVVAVAEVVVIAGAAT